MRRFGLSLTLVLLVALLPLGALEERAAGLHEPGHPRADQGLRPGEEQVFQQALPVMLENRDVDMVVALREQIGRREGCPHTGLVYWIYSSRGTLCFTRSPAADGGWNVDPRLVEGRNPVGSRDHTALATLEAETAAAAKIVKDPETRHLVDRDEITYPNAYERIIAELDSPRSGDFIIIPVNTADRGGKGAHGHLGVVQSRSTLLVAGRGARRSPLSRKEESALRIQHVDIAPTMAKALGVRPYQADAGRPARLLNGRPSATALLERQDGRPIDSLLEPVFNTFVISVDGLRPEDVTPGLMPRLHELLDETCRPGGACATSYDQARGIMVSATNANHVAMVTGGYGEDSGVVANGSFNRSEDSAVDLDEPQLNFAETLFDVIEREKPWLRTAGVFGKEKLRSLFDCTRRADGRCGPSSANPEGVEVSHLAPDFLGGADTSPSDPDRDCPAEPGSGSGYSTNECTMDVAIGHLRREDPDFTFINLPEVDAYSHLFGAGSPPALAAVRSADEQIGKLADALRESGRWQRSTIVVTADHNFGNTVNPEGTIFLDQRFSGAGPSAFEVLTHGGSASVFLTGLEDPDGPLTMDQQNTLKELRKRALETPGVTEALYRLPNPADPASGDPEGHTLDAVHPIWNLAGSDRIGELLITASETHSLEERPQSGTTLVFGEHGHPTDRHVPFMVISGGTYVRDATIAPSGPVDEGDDTAALPEQAELVDLAPTISWMYGVEAPAGNRGRVLTEAFTKHPTRAQAAGDITEPIANRGAIFIYDANNSVNVNCFVRPATCGEPVPQEAKDPGFVPNLRALASGGTLTRFGTMAAWPSVTFPNHYTIGVGAYPGHHGLVNNRFYLRRSKKIEKPIEPTSLDHPLFTFSGKLLSQEVETLQEAIHRSFGDWEPADGPSSTKAYTAAVNEPSARGADYATLEPDQSYPNPAEYIATENPAELLQDTTQSCGQEQSYGTESVLDHIGQTQARRLFEDPSHPVPKYLINNFTITDGAGHKHGAHAACTFASYRDSDRRLGRILGAMRRSGTLGETLIIVTGDHGMENENLERRGLPSDFERSLDEHGFEHVMADWHVYLLTLDIGTSTTDFKAGEQVSATFTVTDDDTGEPVPDAEVSVRRVEEGKVSGNTDEKGEVTLSFTPTGRSLPVTAREEGFNARVRSFAVEPERDDGREPEEEGGSGGSGGGSGDGPATGEEGAGTGEELPFTGAQISIFLLLAGGLIWGGRLLAHRRGSLEQPPRG